MAKNDFEKAASEANKVEEQVEEMLNEMTDTSKEKAFKLRKPIMYNGEELKELSFDFNKLTGEDCIAVESELLSRGVAVIGNPASNIQYIIRMAARACTKTVGIDIFRTMSATDFNRIRTTAYFFLLNFSV